MRLISPAMVMIALSLASHVSAQADDQSAQTGVVEYYPSVAEPDNSKLSANFQRFLSWFGGEFNNNEQVWQQLQESGRTATGIPADPFEPVHWLHAPVLPANFEKLGNPRWFYVKAMQAGSKAVKRQRFYRFSENSQGVIKLESYGFVDPAKYLQMESKPDLAKNMILSDLKAMPGCEVLFRYEDTSKSYRGQTQQATCRGKARSGKNLFVSDNWLIKQGGIEFINNAKDDKGVQLIGRADGKALAPRRVNYFTGWAAILRGAKDAQRTGKFSYAGNIVIHNEGDRYRLNYDNGEPTGYSIELAQLTYQNTKTAILKAALIDDATGETETYIWANPEATRLGMNLKWIQVGLTLKALDPNYGYKKLPVAKAPMQ